MTKSIYKTIFTPDGKQHMQGIFFLNYAGSFTWNKHGVKEVGI